MPDIDDKIIGIVAIAAIAIVALFLIGPEGKDIAIAGLAAIGGAAVGKAR